jgi:hypothetical protein
MEVTGMNRGTGLTDPELQRLTALETRPALVGAWVSGELWEMKRRGNPQEQQRIHRLLAEAKAARAERKRPRKGRRREDMPDLFERGPR